MSETRGVGLPRKPDWRDQADCRKPEVDPEDFFPAGATGHHLIQAEEAKKTCRACPVAMECARWAIKKRIEDGVWGGLDEVQLRRIRRNNTAAELTDERINRLVRQAWRKDTARPILDAYLDRTMQGDDGHVWWTTAATSITVSGRVLTPAQLGFEIGHGRRPEGHVKPVCGSSFCVAGEHLADSIIRWTLAHPAAV